MLEHPQVGGSIDKLAIIVSKAACGKMKVDKVKESIHAGFDPILSCEDILVKYAKQAIKCVQDMTPTTTFAEFKEPLKDIMC